MLARSRLPQLICAVVVLAAAWPTPAAGADGSEAPSGRAAASALEDLVSSPQRVQVRCATDSGVELCLRRRSVADLGAPALSAAGSAPVCSGTGDDGYRVQAVYAHTSEEPEPVALEALRTAMANIDATFSQSAARSGGMRAPRWVTDSGEPGCEVVLATAHITTGALDYDSLMAELEAQGAVTAVGVGRTKHLVFTEGDLEQPRADTCGIGEGYGDETPMGAFPPNDNLRGTRAAVDDRCWDTDGAGSTSAHELMHTLGAVQDGAPHAGNDGHCTDEYDLMCYGSGLSYPCPSLSDDALFDCGNDDYFNTDALAGQYLCDHWNTAQSPYLHGWDSLQPPRAVGSVTASATPGTIHVQYGPSASCAGADDYEVSVAGGATSVTTSLATSLAAPPGPHLVTVWPRRGGQRGAPATAQVTVPAAVDPSSPTGPRPPNELPRGGIVLSLTDGRGYGMLAWAVDPETAAPVRMRVVIPGVVSREYDWNYTWTDMSRYTGVDRTEALVFLAQLPVGTHTVCFDALDPQGGGWTRLDCRTHTVK